MIKCPHCDEKTLPEFRINISPPGKVFQCSSCHKYSQTPTWHFMSLMIIIFGTVIAMFSGAMMVVSTYLPIVVIGFKLFAMAFFKMEPTTSIQNKETSIRKTSTLKIPKLKIAKWIGVVVLSLFVLQVFSVISKQSIERYIVHEKQTQHNAIINFIVNTYSEAIYSYDVYNPNTLTKDERDTYLTLAIDNNNMTAIETFMNKDFDVDYVVNGHTPLYHALNNNNYKVADALIKKGAKANHIQVRHNGEKKSMVESFMVAYSPKRLQWLALQEAVYSDSKELKKLLLHLNVRERKVLLLSVQSSVSKSDENFLHPLKFLAKIDDSKAQGLAIKGQFEQNSTAFIQAAKICEKNGSSKNAIELYQKAYAIDKSFGALSVALLYDKDVHTKGEAVVWYEEAANSGNEYAKRILPSQYRIYENSNDVNFLIERYQKMYQKGDVSKAKRIGMLYEKKLNDYENAKLWYKKLIVRNNGEMELLLGNLNYNTLQNIKKAKAYYLKSFEKGEAKAYFPLKKIDPQIALINKKSITAPMAYTIAETLNLDNATKKDAFLWYKKAIRFNNKKITADACSRIGTYYYEQTDYDRAVKWYKHSGKLSSSYQNIGYINYMFYNNTLEAIEWYEKAYAMGTKGIALIIGTFYTRDLNDNDQAEVWFRRAVMENDDAAVDAYHALYNSYKEPEKKLKIAAFMISLTGHVYKRQHIINTLRQIWDMNDNDIEQAYEMQLSMNLKQHYEGDFFNYVYEIGEY